MKKAVMYGAGNIGRGFIGQLFSQSGYEVVFIDVNPVIVDKLNEDKKYPIRIISDEGYTEIVVENARAVNGLDVEKASDEIASADIMATAVGANILPKIVNVWVKGLKKRWSENNFAPLNIIICENLLDANHYLAKLLKQELSDKEKEYFDKTVGLIEASIGRMVPVVTPEMQGDNPLRVCVEEYCELPVDKDAFKGEIPNIKNMVPFSPFDFYVHRKLFIHNMGHATMAYLGFLNNYTYIWEACRNYSVKLITLRAMLELGIAMSRAHGVPLEQLIDHAEDLLFRFGNRLLGDTVDRVGRDPVRKLAANDRFIGAANLCLKNGISPVYVSIGAAAAFMFANENDEAAVRVQTVVRNEGLEAALKQFCGIDESSVIFGLVKDFYSKLKSGSSIEEVLRYAEKLKHTVK